MNELSMYLSKATTLLHEYQWIYNFQATHILVNGIFSHIPDVWRQALLCLSDDDLKLLASGIFKDEWATCIVEFIQKYHELTLPSASEDKVSSSACWEQIPDKLRKGMSPKKQHEVLHLASFIYQQCNYSHLSRILDLGSGLGYLGKLLHHKSGYRVLGLEADAGHVVRAVKMQQPICSSGVNHMALTLNPAHKKEGWNLTVEDVRHALQDQNNWIRKCSCGQVQEDPDSSGSVEDTSSKLSDHESMSPSKLQMTDDCVCMVSLHSCGDLSPTAMRLFLQLPETRLLILLSCCYHKMKTLERPSNSQLQANLTLSTLESSLIENKSDIQVKEMDKMSYNYLCNDSIENSHDKNPANDSSNKIAALTLLDRSRGESSSYKSENKKMVRWEEELFPDFPMSKLLKSLVPSNQKFLKRPLLRLASEITVEMWKLMTPAQHDEHAIHVMGRAVLELYSLKGGYRLKKRKRKGLRKTQVSSFKEYFGDALKRFELTNCASKDSQTSYLGKEEQGLSSTFSIQTEAVPVKRLDGSSIEEESSLVHISSHCNPSYCVNGKYETPEQSVEVSAFSVDENLPYVDEEDDELTIRRYSEDSDKVLSEILGLKQHDGSSPSHVTKPLTDHSTVSQFETHFAKLNELTEELCTPKVMHLTKAVYALQAIIQSVAEGFILADRLAFLLEEGGRSVNASLVQIFDRSLSPRSLAIVARKCSSE